MSRPHRGRDLARLLLVFAAMSLIDVLIIYLASGTPSFVFEFTRTDHRSVFGKLRSAMLALLFWPVHLCILGNLALSSVRQRTKNERIEAIRKKIEDSLYADTASPGLFEFRDAFYRSASLADASAADLTRWGNQELFAAAGHPNSALAARCAARSNRRKVRRHLDDSFSELSALLAEKASEAVHPDDSDRIPSLQTLLRGTIPGLAERFADLYARQPHVPTRVRSDAARLSN